MHREAQEIESLRGYASRRHPIGPRKGNQACFIRVKRKAKSLHPLPEYLHHSIGVATKLECNDEVIRVADELRSTLEPWFHLPLEPKVQHVMKIDIPKHRRQA